VTTPLHQTTWKSPSNIALVKYWGKQPNAVQIPANPSISFTLSNCYTETSLKLLSGSGLAVRVDGKPQPDFLPKIEQFFDRIQPMIPWIKDHQVEIDTSNTFPHSSGIASSASGFSALSMCLTDLHQSKGNKIEDATRFASELSRLGSGSACRSVVSPLGVWGDHPDYPQSDNRYAVAFEDVHEVFTDYQDVILLVHKGSKSVSSTTGHGLIEGHPFAPARFKQAAKHMTEIKQILQTGDLTRFIELVELEALTLHALMMSSATPYVLMMPETVAVIHEIQRFREQSGVPIGFTLDAGANVHVLFPKRVKEEAMAFINNRLAQYCQDGSYICDQVGNGPERTSPC
jgi:diphosphomevalonate decarboxylase